MMKQILKKRKKNLNLKKEKLKRRKKAIKRKKKRKRLRKFILNMKDLIKISLFG